MYLSESSPLAIRGSISTSTQMGICIGLFLSQVLGLPDFLGTDRRWPMLFFGTALASVLQLILTALSPESPRYLYIVKRDKLKARKALDRLRSAAARECGDVDDELRVFEKEAEVGKVTPHVSVYDLFSKHKYFWPLSVAIAMQLSQQWSGISGITGYSNILFQRTGVAVEHVGYANLSIGIISIVTAVAVTMLIDRVGRRTLHLCGMTGMIAFGAAISLFSLLSVSVQRKNNVGFRFTLTYTVLSDF